ncbi:hypothetical protein [Krasilnikoviella flava]|uniref:Uncharacterized protein n=1 Tax=Krasilnikoviella flava TaxID=526729 RepID=A0A1T5K072_9MICO|nr:hypothetical protein [Krasilnikoviella flava]SKC57014.1 hypothetical protein SAMN04324258_1717 [Krasilnikoviella flava]
MTSRDLTVLAELDYRQARLAETYQRGTPAWVRAAGRWAKGLVRRVRARAVARDAVQRLGATIDAVAARTDADAWEIQVTRRADQISHGLEALRPQDGAARRAA